LLSDKSSPDVVALPVVKPEFWRVVNLVTVRGRPYSPGVGALVQEAMRKQWFRDKAISARLAEEKHAARHERRPRW
jgi:LysR family transcriptional regulator, hydrogen peroxide-inducible genes activator